MFRAAVWRLLALAALAAAGVMVLLVFPVGPFLVDFLDNLEGLGVGGALLVILIYIVACVLMVPGTIISFGAGAAYGPVLGTAVVSVGSTLGAAAAFWCGRTLARGLLEEKLLHNPRFRALDQAVGDEGFKIVLLTRLSPVFPFNLLNYAFGITRVRFRDYLVASWLGMLPGTVLYVYIGSTVRNVADWAAGRVETTPAQYGLYAVGLAATVAVTVLVTRAARRALARTVPQVAEPAGADRHDAATRPAE